MKCPFAAGWWSATAVPIMHMNTLSWLTRDSDQPRLKRQSSSSTPSFQCTHPLSNLIAYVEHSEAYSYLFAIFEDVFREPDPNPIATEAAIIGQMCLWPIVNLDRALTIRHDAICSGVSRSWRTVGDIPEGGGCPPRTCTTYIYSPTACAKAASIACGPRRSLQVFVCTYGT